MFISTNEYTKYYIGQLLEGNGLDLGTEIEEVTNFDAIESIIVTLETVGFTFEIFYVKGRKAVKVNNLSDKSELVESMKGELQWILR